MSARRKASQANVRRRVLLAGVAGAVVLTGGGVAAGAFIKSPQQVAAEKAPPPLQDLTAPVEKRVLTESLITRGAVAPERTIPVRPTAGGKGARSVYTKVKATEGDEVRAGSVLVEVSGRPIIALSGAVPAYRDLAEGDQGDDVTQLQRALTSLGYGLGQDRLGRFGPGTSTAVTRLYRKLGYSVPSTEGSGAKPARESATVEGEDAGADKQAEVPDDSLAQQPLMPAAEIIYVPQFPAYAEQVSAEIGADATEHAMALSAGRLVVTGQLTAREREQVKTGQRVVITSSRTGAEVTGKVTRVASKPTKDGERQQSAGGEEHFAISVKPGKKLAHAWAGQSVRLTVEAASSKKPVLAVPSAAVSSSAGGRATVTVKDSAGSHRVDVSVGMSADGFVQITPTDKGTLKTGDMVVVGARAEDP